MATKLLYTIDEAARLIGVGRTHLYGEITAGRIESVKIGRARRVPADALELYVMKLRQEARDERMPDAVA